MFGLGWQEFLIVLVIVLVLFGGTKIPELLRGVGRGVGELQQGLDEGKRSFERSLHEDDAKRSKTSSIDERDLERQRKEEALAARAEENRDKSA